MTYSVVLDKYLLSCVLCFVIFVLKAQEMLVYLEKLFFESYRMNWVI